MVLLLCGVFVVKVLLLWCCYCGNVVVVLLCGVVVVVLLLWCCCCGVVDVMLLPLLLSIFFKPSKPLSQPSNLLQTN